MKNGVESFTVPMHVGFDRALVPLRLMPKSWETCSFNEVLNCPKT